MTLVDMVPAVENGGMGRIGPGATALERPIAGLQVSRTPERGMGVGGTNAANGLGRPGPDPAGSSVVLGSDGRCRGPGPFRAPGGPTGGRAVVQPRLDR